MVPKDPVISGNVECGVFAYAQPYAVLSNPVTGSVDGAFGHLPWSAPARGSASVQNGRAGHQARQRAACPEDDLDVQPARAQWATTEATAHCAADVVVGVQPPGIRPSQLGAGPQHCCPLAPQLGRVHSGVGQLRQRRGHGERQSGSARVIASPWLNEVGDLVRWPWFGLRAWARSPRPSQGVGTRRRTRHRPVGR